MRILVTGSNGFIASNLIKCLEKDNNIEQIICVNRQKGLSIETARSMKDRILEVYCQLQNEPYVQSLLRWIKPDIIYHMAARQESTPEAYLENVQATINLLRFAPQELKKFIYASSSTVYGNRAQESLDKIKIVNETCDWDVLQLDHSCHEDSPTFTTSLYASSKLAGESLVSSYSINGSFETCILRYVAAVGHGATHGVLPDLIKKLKGDKPELELFGDEPGSVKPYIYISDLIEATYQLVQNGAVGTYNVSPSDNISIKDLANVVMETIDIHKPVRWLGQNYVKPGDNILVKLDNTKLMMNWPHMKYPSSAAAIVAASLEYKEKEGF